MSFATCSQAVTDAADAGVFRAVFLKMYQYYDSSLTELCEHPKLQDPPIPRLWKVFTSVAINGGNHVVTIDHVNEHDQPGLRVIIAFGEFDHKESARLVCEELGVDIELPPGIPLLLPSALFRHQNTKITGANEKRGSMVFWSAGGPFRWMDVGGKQVNQLTAEENAARKERLAACMEKIVEWFPTGRTSIPLARRSHPQLIDVLPYD